jgi:2-haloacid dehalogenase
VIDAISADEVEQFKSAAERYRHGAARTGTQIDRMVHVAGPAFDVLGATRAGMQGVWLNREGGPWESFVGVDPALTVDSFHGVADELGARIDGCWEARYGVSYVTT